MKIKTVSNSELLFSEDCNKISGPAKYNQNPYEYYQKSERKDIEIVRQELNEWFLNYPPEDRKELKSSFKKHFNDSFFELFLNQLFINLGFETYIHPVIEGSSKRPDFFIKRGTMEIYVEAKVVTGKSKAEEAIEKKTNEILDNLNKVKSANFFLQIIKLEFKGTQQPRIKEIIKTIEDKIKTLNPDVAEELITKSGLTSAPFIQIKNRHIELEIALIPKKKSARGEFKRPVGILPIKTFWGGGEDKLREAIDIKAKKFSNIKKPFIICVNTHDIKTTDKLDIDVAIWGAKGLSKNKEFKSFEEKLEQFSESIFVKNLKPRLKNLSGILVTKVFPNNVPTANYYLYENPFSENGFNLEELGLSLNKSRTEFKNDVTGNDLYRIFDIRRDWLL